MVQNWINRLRVPLGFLAAFAFFYLSRVASGQRLAAGLALSLTGLILRSRSAGFLNKGRRLARSGPYAFWRHPLYAGSLILALGLALAGTGQEVWRDLLLGGLFTLFFLVLYPLRIRDEEATLITRFGDDYRAFLAETHRFLPRLRPRAVSDPDRFDWALFRRNREYQAWIGWLAAATILILKGVGLFD